MAKEKPGNAERRARVEQMRAEQARRERLRSLGILGICVAVVVGLLAVAVVKYLHDDKQRNAPVTGIGATAAAAGCDPLITRTPSGDDRSGAAHSHVDIGTKITYRYSPPAFGQHWPNFLQTSEYRGFYSPADRPELERMVHSLEHGHTLVWYDDTIKAGSKAYRDLQTIADKYEGTTSYVNVVPWLPADGGSFPSGKHVAITHWTGPQDKQQGVWEYCSAPSGKVIHDFVDKYPNTDSPEAGAP